MEKREEVKIRYSKPEIELIKKKAQEKGLTINKYQIETSRKAKVKIEVKDD